MFEDNNKGELFGFDSNEKSTENIGYTVTPEGDYFENAEIKTGLHQNEETKSNIQTTDNKQYNSNSHYRNEFVFSPDVPKKNMPKKPKSDRKCISIIAFISGIVVAAIIGATFGIGLFALSNDYFSDNSYTVSGGQQNNVNINVENIDLTVVEAAAQKVTPSVVGIRTTVSVNNFFFGQQESSGEGSGVVYTADGYIITNYHVIQEAVENKGNRSEILVFLSKEDEKGHTASVVGYNISHDLAVIKINVKGLTPIKFADSSKLNVGQFVVAVGNPGGLQFMGSVTYGVISGLNRILSDSSSGNAVELIQTDAAINPGNSGGALVNVNGELVGINSSKLVSESYEGMGFAIPSNTTKDICDKIISKEYDPAPYIGITISEKYDADTLKKYNFPVGAVVYSVASGSPADECGIKSGDIITVFNNVEITNYTVLSDALKDCKPNDIVSLKVYRAGNSYDVRIKIGSNNSQ